jgi:hypothetical protein
MQAPHGTARIRSQRKHRALKRKLGLMGREHR